MNISEYGWYIIVEYMRKENFTKELPDFLEKNTSSLESGGYNLFEGTVMTFAWKG